MSVARIDFAKAYDVVPYPWVLRLLKVVRAPRIVRRAMKKVLRQWQTDLEVKAGGGVVRILVKFRRGLFPGDSLSPLLFGWTVEAKRKARQVDAAEVPGTDEVWWAAVYRQPAWKVPGPDGVCAYW